MEALFVIATALTRMLEATNRAVVALANKNARMAWVLLAADQCYMPEHTAA
jgi:hypothetical protein